jgi:hypothetical protein
MVIWNLNFLISDKNYFTYYFCIPLNDWKEIIQYWIEHLSLKDEIEIEYEFTSFLLSIFIHKIYCI